MKRLMISGLVVGLIIGMAGRAFSVEKTEAKTKYLEEKKSPNTALLWSLLITGAGQIYNKETPKGLLMLGGKILCIATMFKDETTTSQSGGGGVTITMTTTEKKIQTPQLIGALGISIWSMIDAYKGADRYNEKLKEKYGLSLLLQENRPTLCLKYSF
ncbi:MAG: hypothetical protein AAB267_03615 [Candidatus Desantisbacteria bacterium]